MRAGKITRDTPPGRVLMALRAGPLDGEQARERWGDSFSTWISLLLRQGFVSRTDGGSYRLTEAGRQASPTRRGSCAEVKQIPAPIPTVSGHVREAVFAALQRAQHPMKAFSIAFEVDSSQTTIAKALDRLVADGLVERQGRPRFYTYSVKQPDSPTKENCVMARVRVPGNTLQSWSDVDQALSKIGELDRELALLETSQQEQIDKVKANIKACAEPLQSKKTALEQSIQLYAENNRAEFRTSKTKVLTFGSVGFRLSTRVAFKRGVDVVQALKDLGLAHCIRVKEEADKEAMKNLPAETLAECGASLRTEDAFGYEINREKLAEAA